MYKRNKGRTNNGTLRNSSIDWIFLWRLPTQNHSKPSFTVKRQNKVKYLTQKFKIPKFQKTSIPNSVESPEYIKCYSFSSPRPVKSLRNYIRYNCKNIFIWSRRPKTILEIIKKITFLQVINKLIIYKLFRDFLNHKKKTNRMAVCSCTAFPTFLNTGPPLRPSNNIKNNIPYNLYW